MTNGEKSSECSCNGNLNQYRSPTQVKGSRSACQSQGLRKASIYLHGYRLDATLAHTSYIAAVDRFSLVHKDLCLAHAGVPVFALFDRVAMSDVRPLDSALWPPVDVFASDMVSD